MNKQLISSMNTQLANWNVLYTKLHHYHWYVKGQDFFLLHEKFEELYNEAAATVDEIAERILMVGGEPLSTLSQYLNTATLNEAQGRESANEMVSTLVEDFGSLVVAAKEIIESAEKLGDHPTVDLFVGLTAALEKHQWMLRSYLTRSTVTV